MSVLLDDLHARKREPNYRAPESDLGYCHCGTVWNLDAIAAMGFESNACPDCGSPPLEIERRVVDVVAHETSHASDTGLA